MKDLKKKILYVSILASYIPILIFPIRFILTGFFVAKDIFLILGAFSGLITFILIFWQYVLGLKPIQKLFTKDIVTLNNLHKWFGINGFILIIIHPIFLILDYLLNFKSFLLIPSFDYNFNLRIIIGELSFLLIFFVWITSTYLKKNITFRAWKKVHLLNYLIMPLIFLHSDTIGTFFESKELTLYFRFLLIVYILVLLYRIGLQTGLFKYKYILIYKKLITSDVMELTFKPFSKYINPINAQFINIQLNILGESHPFTISNFNNENKEISISPKASGNFSKLIHTLEIGKIVYLDGSYGVFTQNILENNIKNIILIAGGIGITPFISFLKDINLKANNYNEIYLFYGNKTFKHIAYYSFINNINNNYSKFKFVNVLSNLTREDQEIINSKKDFESGYINLQLIKKYIKGNLNEYSYFLCGPTIMMQKLDSEFINNKIEKKKIFKEEFTW